LREPAREGNGFRQYEESDVRRLRFIKRAQELGFSLDDVASLVSLSAETDQVRVREITQQRVLDIRQRATQLEAMAVALEGLVTCCQKSARGDHCPIIAALVDHDTRTAEQVAA
jgi:MerR family mercuric resistance operon transcriptional regulator